MLKKIIIGLMLSSVVVGVSWAAEQDPVEVRVIGSSFKVLAKGYVAAVNIEKLKADKIARVESMRKDWFAGKYAQTYKVIKDLPADIKRKHGITETISKAQAVRSIKGLDKKKLYEIIDNVPDRIIAEQFYEYVRHVDSAGVASSLKDRIALVWGKAMTALNKGAPASKKKER